MKKHILLIEKEETELKFFTDALEASKLSFLCSIAKSKEQAKRILKNIVPDIIFIDLSATGNNLHNFLSKVDNLHMAPVVLYSTGFDRTITDSIYKRITGYFRLPESVRSMAFILQNLLGN